MISKTLKRFIRHICYCGLTTAFIIPQTLLCQSTFFKTFGDTVEGHMNLGHSVLQADDGNYIVAGEYGSYFTYNPADRPQYHFYGDVYIIKTNEHGDTIWTKTYGNSNEEEAAYSMDKTSDGNYIICAYNESSYTLWLIKIDLKGDSIWSRKYPVGRGYCIKRTNDNGYIVTGSGFNGKNDVYLLKINSLGDTLWLKTYDNNANPAKGRYALQTTDNGYIIVGDTQFPDSSGMDIWLIKTDSRGDTLWTKTYGGADTDMPHSICETTDGGYFITGEYTTKDVDETEFHIWLLKTDSHGDTIWTKRIDNGTFGDYAYSCKQTSDGGFIIAGETNSDIYLIKLDKEFNYQWFSTIGRNFGGNGGRKNYSGYDVAETSDGGYIITGYIEIDVYMDLCLAKVDNKGQITSVNDVRTGFPIKYALLQNYPNPFNPSTNISFIVPKHSFVSLKIFDLIGREIATVVSEYISAGNYVRQWNAEGYASGIYFCRLQAGSFSETKKLILLR